MEYIGEHTFIGNLGQSLVALAFVSALLMSASYFLSYRLRQTPHEIGWLKLGRISVFVHLLSIVGLITCMFVMLANHYFEYEYVFKHSSEEMPTKYILVAFWGGQQGSLMLWSFWNVVMVLLLRYSAKQWESLVVGFMALIQVFVVAMLLGIDIGPYHLGTSPFTLIREVNQELGFLWSQIPDYLELDPTFQDGNGLTPSLQNYWMIIHPPTLFAGFALASIPAAFAFAGVVSRKYKEWITPALPWTYLAISILGTGILFGGAWAYESLNFGGFWAWDPVENASLIPWIFLVAGAHVMLITKNRGTAKFSSAFLILIAFWFVIYSSFLTRSGVLGEDSVHSFTGDGMTEELLMMQVFFIWLGIWALIAVKRLRVIWTIITAVFLLLSIFVPVEIAKVPLFLGSLLLIVIFSILAYIKGFPKDEQEENLISREFWMFAGGLILVIAAFQVIGATSLPAMGRVFDQEWKLYGDETERNAFYNSWQVLFAIFYVFLMGWSQYVKYKNDRISVVLKKTLFSLLISFVITLLIVWGMNFEWSELALSVLIFSAVYAIVGNIDYWIRFLKGKLNNSGSSIAHIGFALIILGAVLSNGKQEVISVNSSQQRVDMMSSSFKENEDIQIFRGDTIKMGEYFVHYKDEFIENDYFYNYRFEYYDQEPRKYLKGDSVRYKDMTFVADQDHTAGEDFLKDMSQYWLPIVIKDNEKFISMNRWQSIQPGAFQFEINPRILLDTKTFKNNFPEPGTKRFLSHDVFTHVRYADLTPQKINSVRTGKRISEYMVPYEIKNIHQGDTVPTPGHVFIFDTLFYVADSMKQERDLLPNDSAVAVQFRIFEIEDRSYKRPVEKELLHITRSGELNVPDRQEYKHLGISMIIGDFFPEGEPDEEEATHDHKEGETHEDHNHPTVPELDGEQEAKLDSASLAKMKSKIDALENELSNEQVKSNVNPLADASFNIQVADKEYVVMKAIVFPWINILWLGTILMGLGTTMAVFSRIKKQKGK